MPLKKRNSVSKNARLAPILIEALKLASSSLALFFLIYVVVTFKKLAEPQRCDYSNKVYEKNHLCYCEGTLFQDNDDEAKVKCIPSTDAEESCRNKKKNLESSKDNENVNICGSCISGYTITATDKCECQKSTFDSGSALECLDDAEIHKKCGSQNKIVIIHGSSKIRSCAKTCNNGFELVGKVCICSNQQFYDGNAIICLNTGSPEERCNALHRTVIDHTTAGVKACGECSSGYVSDSADDVCRCTRGQFYDGNAIICFNTGSPEERCNALHRTTIDHTTAGVKACGECSSGYQSDSADDVCTCTRGQFYDGNAIICLITGSPEERCNALHRTVIDHTTAGVKACGECSSGYQLDSADDGNTCVPTPETKCRLKYREIPNDNEQCGVCFRTFIDQSGECVCQSDHLVFQDGGDTKAECRLESEIQLICSSRKRAFSKDSQLQVVRCGDCIEGYHDDNDAEQCVQDRKNEDQSDSPKSSSNKGLAIGLIVGGIVLLVIGAVFFYIFAIKQSSSEESSENASYDAKYCKIDNIEGNLINHEKAYE